jgi:hypothetical protein
MEDQTKKYLDKKRRLKFCLFIIRYRRKVARSINKRHDTETRGREKQKEKKKKNYIIRTIMEAYFERIKKKTRLTIISGKEYG